MMTKRNVIVSGGVMMLAVAGLACGVWAQPTSTAAPGSSATATTSAAKGMSTLERFLRIRTPGAATVAPDGSLYVRDWPDGVWQLYRYEGGTAGPGTKGVKLTSYTDGLAGYSLSPDGARMLLIFAAGGNENTQISAMDPKTGKITDIISNPKVQFAPNKWLEDSSGFYYSGNAESPTDFYLYRFDFGTGKSTKVLSEKGSWSVSDANRDGSRIIVEQYLSASDSKVWEISTADGARKELTIRPAAGNGGGEPTAANNVVGYLPGPGAAAGPSDGGTVLMTSDVDGMSKLYKRDLKTGDVSKALPKLDRFEVDTAAMNTERNLLAVVTNEDGYGVLHVYRLPSMDEVTLPAIEKGVVSLADLRGQSVSWTLSNARTAGITYHYTVPPAGGKAAGEAKQITAADTQGLDLSGFPLPELVKYSAFDGTEIPAFVYLPKGYTKGTPIPFVVNYHGGPEGQSRPAFSATIQYLLNEGFGVMQPNVRGSSGYGRAFIMMDDYKKRWDSVRDGVDACEWLVSNGYATAGKIAAYGGSYGGYMSLATVVEDQVRVDENKRKQRLFGASVDVVGIASLETFLQKTAGYRRKLREVEYGPLSDPEFLRSVSPIHKIDKLNVPLFIAHGYNDPRVPVEEAMQIAVALKDRGVPTRLFVASDEGHGFQKLDNRLIFTDRMVTFLKETIGK